MEHQVPNEAWLFIKDIGTLLNYLLVPIFLLAWKARGYFDALEKRISALEWLHRIRGCHDLTNRVEGED